MKVLIVYSSRWGVSKQACEMLVERFNKSVDAEIYNINDNPPTPKNFDIAVIGGSIRYGKLNSKLKKYIKKHLNDLSNMNTAAFICCGYSNNFDDYRIMQLPKALVCSLGVHYFGGELKPDKIRGIDKAIVKMARESIITQDIDVSERDRAELPEIMPDTIYALAERICALGKQ